MKKLLACAAVLGAALAVHLARTESGSADLSGQELAGRSAAAVLELLAKEGLPVSGDGIARTALIWFFLPGAFMLGQLGVIAHRPVELTVAFLLSWWAWGTAPRLVWSIVGRPLGLVNVGQFHWWLLLVPPWRPFYRLWLRLARWWRQFLFGSQATAAWTGVIAAMTLVYRPGDSVFLGRLWAFGAGLWQPLGIRGSKHVTVVASTGSGKTRWLMAWLGMLHKKGSAFVVDCDGQIVNALGPSLERKGHRVINLDPYRLTRFPGACWNAIAEIDRAVKRHGREAAVRFAHTLAEALVKEDNNVQPIFANSARVFLHGLVPYVWLFEPEERRNLIRVRELLTRGLPERVVDAKQDAFDVLLSVMRQAVEFDDGCGGKITAVIARAASVMKSGKNREGGNPFRSTAVVQTAWLDFPEVAAISKRSDFSCEDLKTGNPCVFVCAPVTDIQSKLSGWVRALTMMATYAFQNMPGRLKVPCSFFIDETPALGRVGALETTAPAFRKYGIRLVIITQDVEKLRQVYPHSWEGFIGNSMCTLWMSTDHHATLEYLSKVLGMRTLKSRVADGAISKVRARMEKREYALWGRSRLAEA